MEIDWGTTYSMIMAIGTFVTSLAIIITAIIALITWRNSEKEKKEKYILDRQAITCGILSELNSNENILKYLKCSQIKAKENIAFFAHQTSGKDIAINYSDIISIFINSFEDFSFTNLKKSGISYKKFGMIFEITFVYKKIGVIKKLLMFIIGRMEKESSQIKGENNIKYAAGTLKLIKEDIDKALIKIDEVYGRFKDETNFDFKSSKYYREFTPSILK